MKTAKFPKLSGFTLIETIIVLGIVVLIAGFSTLAIAPIKERIDFERTIHTFKTNYYLAQKIGTIKGQGSNISKLNEKIIFKSQGINFRQIELPKNTSVYGLSNQIFIPNTGFSAPKTIIFRQGKMTRQLKIQMMWGNIIES